MLPARYIQKRYYYRDPRPVLKGVQIIDSQLEAINLSETLYRVSRAGQLVAIDTEFDVNGNIRRVSLPGRTSLVTAQVAWRNNRGDIHSAWIDCRNPQVLLRLKPWLEDPSCPKLFHNFPVEAHSFADAGVWLQGFYADTLQMSRLSDPEKLVHTLDGDMGLAVQLLGLPRGSRPGTKDALGTFKIGKRGQILKTIELLPMSQIVADLELLPFQQVYAVQDATDTLQIFDPLLGLLQEIPWEEDERGLWGFYEEYYRSYQPILWRLERRGMCVDLDYADEVCRRLNQHMEDLESDFLEWAGCEVDLNSNQHKSWLFYGQGWETIGKGRPVDILGHDLPIPPAKNKTEQRKWEETGQIRCDAEAVRWILSNVEDEEDQAALQAYLEWTKMSTLVKTFLQPLADRVVPSHASGLRTPGPIRLTGDPSRIGTDENLWYVHTELNFGPRTGRLSSKKPNLQNIATNGELGQLIRDIYTCESGQILLVADYSQLELRILAYFMVALFGDHSLADILASGEDLHQRTADQLTELCGFIVGRPIAKNINFGIIYGATKYKLARTFNIPIEQAEALLAAHERAYPGIYRYTDWAVASARRTGAARTLLGRYRFLPAINSRDNAVRGHAERQARNTPIQGSAQDIVMLAQIALENDEEFNYYGGQQRLQVHDEIISVAPAATWKEALKRKCYVMSNTLGPDKLGGVCLPVEGHGGQTWGEAKAGSLFLEGTP